MGRKIYWLVFSLILIFSFAIRIIPVLDNNFHFTMDQGNDAVYVREIVERGQLLLVGPETNIAGLYNGVIWYYFLAVGYIIFSGHPAAAVFLLIAVNLVFLAAVMWIVGKKISPWAGLSLGVALSTYWWFYDTSRYAFNPFPLVALSILTIFLLVDYLERPKHQLIWASVLVGLAFHAEVAGFSALVIFFLLVNFFLFIRKRLELKKFLLSIGIICMFFLPNVIYEFKNDFASLYKIQNDIFSRSGVFSESRFTTLASYYFEMVTNAAFPQNKMVGVVLIFSTLAIWFIKKRRAFTESFFALTMLFVVVSLLWFGAGTGWRTWHTVAILVFVYICLLLIIFDLPGKLRFGLFTVVLGAQILFFRDQYAHFSTLIDDQSILRNELAAIDWVYQRSEGQGFSVYNYVPSVQDFHYQYLFWWQGRKKYGYVPCEYGRYPGVPSFYVPGYEFYRKPKKPCAKLRFLIIEPDTNEGILNQWYTGVTDKTKLVDRGSIGKITVEKRRIVP